MDYINKIFNEDCISGMSRYPDKSIDMIMCDMPYGITHCRWDGLFPLEALWKQYKRIIKDNGAICLTACQPFTTRLISSQSKLFKYCWYWNKNMATGFANAKKQPLRCVEEICVFYKRPPVYNPQGIVTLDTQIHRKGISNPRHNDWAYSINGFKNGADTYITNYPRQVLNIKCERGLHPTQKPVALFEYLIRTYTNPGDLVLDNCMGSGTTAIACMHSGRNYTGFEFDEAYFKISENRILKECISK